MGLSNSLEFFIPDTVSEVEILRIGSACYPHGSEGEPETVEHALKWAFRSDWGTEKLASLGITWTRHEIPTPTLTTEGIS